MQASKINKMLSINFDFLLIGLLVVFMLYSFFEPYFNQIIGSIMKYYIIALILLYVLRNHGKFIIQFPLKYYLFWFLLLCISLLWTSDYSVAEQHFFTVFAAIALLICITQPPINRQLIKCMVFSLWLGSFLIGLLSLFFHSAYQFVVASRQVLTLFGEQTDPNNQAVFLMYGISCSVYYLLIYRRKFALSIFSIITIIVNIVSMVMCASRGGFVSIGFMALIVIVFLIKDWKLKLWAITVTVFAVLLSIKFVPYFANFESIERLIMIDSYEGGSLRIDIWKKSLQLIDESPFFYLIGSGWGSYYKYLGWKGMHNTYLEIFCNTGLLGICMFFYPVLIGLRYLIKRERFLPVFIAFSVLLPVFFLDSINKRFFWNALYFLFISYYLEKEEII